MNRNVSNVLVLLSLLIAIIRIDVSTIAPGVDRHLAVILELVACYGGEVLIGRN